jgi:hypothetical protein
MGRTKVSVEATHDLGPPAVDTPETLCVRGSSGFLILEIDGMDEQSEGPIDFLQTPDLTAPQPLQGLLCLVVTTFADQEPRGLGGEEVDDEEGNRPDPLQGEGEPPSPVAVDLEGTTYNAGRDEDAPSPAHADVRADDRSEYGGYDFDGIGSGQGSK